MPSESLQELTSQGTPYFQSIVIRAANNSFAVEFETRDHMIIVTFEHDWPWEWATAPVARNVIVHEIRTLVDVECLQKGRRVGQRRLGSGCH